MNNHESKFYNQAVNCVKTYVLPQQIEQFEDCNCDMDKMYEKYAKSDVYFRKVIKKGQVYEMGYPRCLCHLVHEGIYNSPDLCECSRQSILYVLSKLEPEKEFKVETIETVLQGANNCRFRITVTK